MILLKLYQIYKYAFLRILYMFYKTKYT